MSKNAISFKGKKAAILVYPANNGIAIDIFSKKGRIEQLLLTREQWLELSTMVLSECFGAKIEPLKVVKND